jgi:hypothetical protein
LNHENIAEGEPREIVNQPKEIGSLKKKMEGESKEIAIEPNLLEANSRMEGEPKEITSKSKEIRSPKCLHNI